MSSKDKKQINSMWSFANLFLAMYYINSKRLEDGNNVYISRYFKNLLDCIMNNIEKLDGISKDEIFDKDGNFNKDLFWERFRYSSIKESWGEDIKFDYEKNKFIIKISTKDAENELNKYNSKSINTMNHIVSLFDVMSSHLDIIENEKINNLVLSYNK